MKLKLLIITLFIINSVNCANNQTSITKILAEHNELNGLINDLNFLNFFKNQKTKYSLLQALDKEFLATIAEFQAKDITLYDQTIKHMFKLRLHHNVYCNLVRVHKNVRQSNDFRNLFTQEAPF